MALVHIISGTQPRHDVSQTRPGNAGCGWISLNPPLHAAQTESGDDDCSRIATTRFPLNFKNEIPSLFGIIP